MLFFDKSFFKLSEVPSVNVNVRDEVELNVYYFYCSSLEDIKFFINWKLPVELMNENSNKK